MFLLYYDPKKTESLSSNYPDCKVRRPEQLEPLVPVDCMNGSGQKDGVRVGWMDSWMDNDRQTQINNKTLFSNLRAYIFKILVSLLKHRDFIYKIRGVDLTS